MKVKLIYHLKIYLGESLEAEKLPLVKFKIRMGKSGYYLIVASDKEDELLEIIDSKYLSSKYMAGKKLVVGGIAGSKKEAQELTALITEDCLRIRKDVNLKEYIICGQYC